jgi:hypothetical protein
MTDEQIYFTVLGLAVVGVGYPTYLLARFAPKWTSWSFAMIVVITSAAVALIEPTMEVFCTVSSPLACLGPLLMVWITAAALSITALITLAVGRWQAHRHLL